MRAVETLIALALAALVAVAAANYAANIWKANTTALVEAMK